MILAERLNALVKLGALLEDPALMQQAKAKAYKNNQWFVTDNSQQALDSISQNYLSADALESWLTKYNLEETRQVRKLGLILAGNIPLVGFHDVLTVFISGHHSLIKLSDKDKELLPALINTLCEIDGRCRNYFSFVDRLEQYDAVIATGSNNSAVHFEYYFKHVPHIIRRNRNAIGIIDGSESREDLVTLGQDIFSYFGLGCRNVSKLYLPNDYNTDVLMEALHEYKELVLHNKYKNNFDYNYAIYLLNQDKFLMNGCVLLKESTDISSRIAMLGYEFYESSDHLVDLIKPHLDEIQLIVSNKSIEGLQTMRFGEAQKPKLWDYADGVDTLQFLINLN